MTDNALPPAPAPSGPPRRAADTPSPSRAVITTAAGTANGVALYPVIMWAVAGFPRDMTVETGMALSAFAATGIHILGLVILCLVNRFAPSLAAGLKPHTPDAAHTS